jgi:hypothetical protein
MHHYDAIAKTALMHNKTISNKLKEIIEKTGYHDSEIAPDGDKAKEEKAKKSRKS